MKRFGRSECVSLGNALHSVALKEKMMEGKPAFEIPVLFTSTSIFPNFSVAAFTPVSISFESVTSYFGYPPGKVVHNFK